MGRYRVLQRHEFLIGKERRVLEPGALVDIETRFESKRLIGRGIVQKWDKSHVQVEEKARPVGPYRWMKRIGIWLSTSKYYSGGRLHMYQIALTLAQAGAEVFLITDYTPKWGSDYPEHGRLKLVIHGHDAIPDDIDVAFTDNKGSIGKAALDYADAHAIPVAAMNFESPNWVAEFVPDYAQRLGVDKALFERADYLVANSRESARWLSKWVGKRTPVGVIPPAVNTHALALALEQGAEQRDRPYAVMSARNPAYKGLDVAVKAVMALDAPFDLCLIGQPQTLPQSTDAHKIEMLTRITDAEKYRLFLGSTLALAPSLFEGFGMVPGEALCCGKPAVVYDLPVLREEYGDRLVYAKWNDPKDFADKVRQVVKGELEAKVDAVEARATYGMEAMPERVESVPCFSLKRKRVSAQLIAYWGFLPESVEAIYPHVDEILIAFGPTPHAPRIDDGSLSRIQAMPDPEKKIRVEIRDHWAGKKEMRLWCATNATGNYMLLLDGDEIWAGLDKWLEAEVQFGCPRWINLWHGPQHWVHDYPGKGTSRWGEVIDGRGSVCPHYRWSWWRNSYTFATHPVAVDVTGHPLHITSQEAARKIPECEIYHLGHALPAKVMEAKHDYYLARDGVDAGRIRRKEAWHEWNGKAGDCRDGFVSPVSWELPEIVARACASIQKEA